MKGDLNNDGFLILASSSSPEDYDSSGEIRANDTSSECYYLDDWFYDWVKENEVLLGETTSH